MTLTLEYQFDLGDLQPTWGNASAKVSENSSGGLRVEITHAEIPLLRLDECKGLLSRVCVIDLESRFIDIYHSILESKESVPTDWETPA